MKKFYTPSFFQLCQPLKEIAPDAPQLISGEDKPLKMTFEDQLNALIFYHLEEHVSARHLIQVFKKDDFPVKTLPLKMALAEVVFLKLLIIEGLSS